jgi:maltose/moltooligosaccharide transporter
MFVASIYWYLVSDVIPPNVMGRFYGLVRVVGSGAGIVFGLLMGWGNEHRDLFYLIVALAYGVAFSLTCWGVKEGKYPPLPEDGQRAGFWRNVKIYVTECYSHPYYLCFYLSASIFTLSERSFRLFRIFFAQEVGMSVADFGKVMAATSVVSFFLYMPFGYLADKIHPMRMQLVTMALLPLVSIVSFFTIHSATTFTVWFMVWWVIFTAHAAANGPLFPLLLPNDKFGQFASAQAIMGAFAIMISSYFGGKLLDRIGDYRYVYAWNATFALVALFFAVQVYRGWRKFGGPDHYVPPLSEEPRAFDVLSPAVIPQPPLEAAAVVGGADNEANSLLESNHGSPRGN